MLAHKNMRFRKWTIFDKKYRKKEVNVTKIFSDLGLGAKLIAVGDKHSFYIREYLPGRTLKYSDLQDNKTLITLAKALRKLHKHKEAGEIKDSDPSSPEAQDLVKRIQDFITENMYTCTDKILRGLGKMYSGGGEFTRNIDGYGGEGTAEFVDQAIQVYCDKAE